MGKTAATEVSDSGVEWENTSNVFGGSAEAQIGDYSLSIFTVIGGSNTETYPWGWSVMKDGVEVKEGAATSGRDAAAQAEAHVKGLGKQGNQEMGYPDPVQQELESADLAEDEDLYSLASDDYPELSEILVERLPLPHSERLGNKWRMPPRCPRCGSEEGDDDRTFDEEGVPWYLCLNPQCEVDEFTELDEVRLGAKTASERVCDWCGEPAMYTGRPEGDEGLMPSEYYYACEDHRDKLVEWAGENVRAFGLKVHYRVGDSETVIESPDDWEIQDLSGELTWDQLEALREGEHVYVNGVESWVEASKTASDSLEEIPSISGRPIRVSCEVCGGTGNDVDTLDSDEYGTEIYDPCPSCEGDGFVWDSSHLPRESSQQVKIKTARAVDGENENFMENVAALSNEGMGRFIDNFLYPLAVDVISDQPADIRFNPATGRGPSYDWCRFRRTRFCYFPDELDQAATDEAGYAVWVPLERGFCPREAWDGEAGQKNCPVSEPGPNAKFPDRPLADATVSWAAGGQRYDSRGDPLRPPGR